MPMLDDTLRKIRSFIPSSVFHFFQPTYHFTMSFFAALWYGFPSKDIKVIAVTGTKGKSSTVELINAILESAGNTTALSNTIRFKVGDDSRRNLFKMSMPGRMSLQKFIREAVNKNCNYITIEMTSQGALLFRDRFVEIDTLVFTNLSPEHLEAHGSYENYVEAKVSIARNMSRWKKKTTIIVNADDAESHRFLACDIDRKIKFSLSEGEPYTLREDGIDYTYEGRKVEARLAGTFNLCNILAASAVGKSEGISTDTIIAGVKSVSHIQGRVEKIEAGQTYTVVVDYAHTADSLEKLYKVFRPDPAASRTDKPLMIAILGGTGGGRDTAKRKEMGRLASLYCDNVIVTNEDPYDEDPQKIMNDVASGVEPRKLEIIPDRRIAIAQAIKMARVKDIILITGKGTDPYIMGPNGTKMPWSDAEVAREEIRKQL